MSLEYQIALSLIKNVGPVMAKSMLAYAGSAENVFKTPKSKFLRIPGIGSKTIDQLELAPALEWAKREVEYVEKNNIDVIFYTDPRYPKRLKNCSDSPVLLYTKGNIDLNTQRVISIVGTRQMTDYGRQMTQEIVKELSEHGATVVSGLAYGIDVTAHKECLKHNVPTIGVVAHGFHMLYPAAHKGTAEKMMAQGGLVTEYPSGTIPDRENFPARNRIVAGMADATVVIEAGIKGGALITAEIANSYNRDVFAIPGKIGDEFSEGCNFLIRHHKASLLMSPEDLPYTLGWEKGDDAKKPKQNQLMLAMDLTADERYIMEILAQHDAIAIDELTIKTGLPVSILAMNILNLEMQGFIRSMPGKTYAIN